MNTLRGIAHAIMRLNMQRTHAHLTHVDDRVHAHEYACYA